MIKAIYNNDYYYVNHNNKKVCFIYKSNKRHKTKVINFIKNNKEESKINEFLKPLGLKLNKYAVSIRYKHYEIIDI